LSIDPQVDQTNQPYVFANDNPLNVTDPLGLKPKKKASRVIACLGFACLPAVIGIVGQVGKVPVPPGIEEAGRAAYPRPVEPAQKPRESRGGKMVPVTQSAEMGPMQAQLYVPSKDLLGGIALLGFVGLFVWLVRTAGPDLATAS